MKPMSLIRTALLVLVFGSLAFLAVKEVRQWKTPRTVVAENQAINPAEKSQTARVVAYYFHTTYRCPTCRRIEAFAREAIDTGFARELSDGRLEFQLVNVEKPENRHFIQDYSLFNKSLVLVRIKDGNQIEWANLERIWEYSTQESMFVKYVQDELRRYLEKK